jgi:hypothetical protein
METARATTILATLALLGATSLAYSQTEPPQSPPMKSGKERGAVAAEATPEKKIDPGISKQKKLSMCVDTWDAQTHMTKKEWRVACARSVRDYPDAFDR